MSETALYAFQLAEIGDALWDIFCGLLFLFGVGLWVHGTYFRED